MCVGVGMGVTFGIYGVYSHAISAILSLGSVGQLNTYVFYYSCCGVDSDFRMHPVETLHESCNQRGIPIDAFMLVNTLEITNV